MDIYQHQQFCTSCGAPLTPGVKFCESCGTAVATQAQPQEAQPQQIPQPQAPVSPPAAASKPASTQAPAPSPAASQPVRPAAPTPPAAYHPAQYSQPATYRPAQAQPAKRRKTGLIIGLVVGGVALCCVVLAVILVVTGAFVLPTAKVQQPVTIEEPVEIIPQEMAVEDTAAVEDVAPTEVADVSPTETPIKEPEPSATLKATEAPTREPAPTQKPLNPVASEAQENFSRNLLDFSAGWDFVETDIYRTDLNQDGSWIIALKQPESLVAFIPPDRGAVNAEKIAFVTITFKVRAADAATAGPYGVMCSLQDENNYYAVEILNDQYGIGKMVGGNFTPMTDPYWQKSQFIGDSDENGYIEMSVTCDGYSVGLMINGLGETFPVFDEEENFISGSAALFGAASQEAQDMLMGVFYFKDLFIERIQ